MQEKGEAGGANMTKIKGTDINQSSNMTLDWCTAEEQVYLVVIIAFDMGCQSTRNSIYPFRRERVPTKPPQVFNAS